MKKEATYHKLIYQAKCVPKMIYYMYIVFIIHYERISLTLLANYSYMLSKKGGKFYCKRCLLNGERKKIEKQLQSGKNK